MTNTTDVVQSVAHYAEETLGDEGFRYVSAVVANCKLLALELEALEEEDAGRSVDMEALIIAAYLHDISTIEHGFQNHAQQSTAMAVEFLRKCEMPAPKIAKVEQAILLHTLPFA